MALARKKTSKKKVAKKTTKKKRKSSLKRAIEERGTYHLPKRSEDEQLVGLSDDLVEAYDRLRSFLVEMGEQEVRTSHRAIMFARKTCYAFVRPKKSFIETTVFLPEKKDSDLVKRIAAVSKTKFAHIVQLTHRDQIEAPLTEWLQEAFGFSG